MGNFIFWALIVIAIYYLSSSFRRNPQNFSNKSHTLAYEEAKYLVSLLAKVAKSDGRVNELEARLVSEILDDITARLGGDRVKRDELKSIYNVEKENISNAYEIARKYRLRFGLSGEIAEARVAFLLNLAYIDGIFSDQERKIIEDISDAFGLSRINLQSIIAKFDSFYKAKSSANKTDPYEVLGISQNASFSEIKKRYRELVKIYHPDILMGRGESEEIIEKSTRKLQEINEAYEAIKQNLGEK